MNQPSDAVKKIVFNDGEFYVFTLDYSVAIGKVDGPRFYVPNGHAWYDRVAESTSRREVESHFGELLEALAD